MPLSAVNIKFQYGNKKNILQDINIDIDSGKIIGLMGPSGCGKTTLAKIMAGYCMPSQGNVFLDNKRLPASGFNPVQLIFQHPEKAVNPRWQMKKILEEAGMLKSSHIDRFGISKSWLNRWPNELSAGELQRFCILRAINHKTRYIIADEITTMLDTVTQAQIWHALIDIIKSRSLGALVISHDIKLLQQFCDSIIDFLKINNQAVNG
jgi:peptide/nickel transport system ATP-binding protein